MLKAIWQMRLKLSLIVGLWSASLKRPLNSISAFPTLWSWLIKFPEAHWEDSHAEMMLQYHAKKISQIRTNAGDYQQLTPADIHLPPTRSSKVSRSRRPSGNALEIYEMEAQEEEAPQNKTQRLAVTIVHIEWLILGKQWNAP